MTNIVSIKTPRFPADFGTLAYNEENKRKFLSAGKRLLTVVGKVLMQEGLCENVSVRVNKAGIAVGGDIYAEFTLPGGDRGILITMTDSAVSRRRSDGVIVYGQYREKDISGRLTRIVGSNVELDQDINAQTVTHMVRQMLISHPSH